MRLNLKIQLDISFKSNTLISIMTLLEIRSQVLSTLCEQDTFSRDDYLAVKVSKELEENKDALIEAALDSLVKNGLVAPVSANLWVLTQPLNVAGQEVGLSMETSNYIAETINAYIRGNDLDVPQADPMNLHEGNILFLLHILNDVLNEGEDNSFEKDEE